MIGYSKYAQSASPTVHEWREIGTRAGAPGCYPAGARSFVRAVLEAARSYIQRRLINVPCKRRFILQA